MCLFPLLKMLTTLSAGLQWKFSIHNMLCHICPSILCSSNCPCCCWFFIYFMIHFSFIHSVSCQHLDLKGQASNVVVTTPFTCTWGWFWLSFYTFRNLLQICGTKMEWKTKKVLKYVYFVSVVYNTIFT